MVSQIHIIVTADSLRADGWPGVIFRPLSIYSRHIYCLYGTVVTPALNCRLSGSNINEGTGTTGHSWSDKREARIRQFRLQVAKSALGLFVGGIRAGFRTALVEPKVSKEIPTNW